MARKRNLKAATVRYVSDRDLNRYGESAGSHEGHTVHNPAIGRQIEGLETPDTRSSTAWAPASWSVQLAEATLEQRVSWTADSNADVGRDWDPDGRHQSVVYFDMHRQAVVERTYRNDRDTEYVWERHESPVRHNVTFKRVVSKAAYTDYTRQDWERSSVVPANEQTEKVHKAQCDCDACRNVPVRDTDAMRRAAQLRGYLEERGANVPWMRQSEALETVEVSAPVVTVVGEPADTVSVAERAEIRRTINAVRRALSGLER